MECWKPKCLLNIWFSLTSTLGLDILPEPENEFYKKEAKDMVNIVQKLIREG